MILSLTETDKMIRLQKVKNGIVVKRFFLDCSLEKAIWMYGDEGYQIEVWA